MIRPGWVLGVLALALHAYAGEGYGWFRDEMYFIVCGWHPDWGYVDQPSLVPLIAAATHFLSPSSPWLMRMVPAFAHAATVILTAETARQLGGGRFAQALAAGSVLTAPVFLVTGTILTTDVFQPLTWLACAHALIRIERGDDRRWWWLACAAMTVGLWSKYMIAFWLFALLIGILATPIRHILANRVPWLAALLTVVLVLPNVFWQVSHGFPFLELGTYTVAHKNPALTPWAFLWAEARELNLGALPVWIAGIAGFAFWSRLSAFRCFVIAFVILIATMIVLHGKAYYPAGVYPVFFAAGAVLLEEWSVRYVVATSVAVLGAIGLPYGLPILPIQTFVAYQLQIRPGPLPQHFADMFGWPDTIVLVQKAYDSLSADEKPKSVVIATNYGDASAVEVLGGMTAISGHNNYDLWGPQGHDGSVVIQIGGNRDNLARVYTSVDLVGTIDQPLAMDWVNGRSVWICRGRHVPLNEAWPRLRHYD